MRKVLCFSIAAVLVAALCVEAKVPTTLCDCWEGSRIVADPCTCSCPANLALPFCGFSSTETKAIKIIVATNASKTTPAPVSDTTDTTTTNTDLGFSTAILTESIMQHYNDFVNIQFARPVDEPTDFTRYHSDVLCLMYSVNASLATNFLTAAANDEPWLRNLGITDANVFYADPALAEDLQGLKLFEIPEATYGPFEIHIWDLIWVLLLICPIFCCCCLECCCCFTNTQKKAEELQKYAAPGPNEGGVIITNDPYNAIVPVAAAAVAAAEPVPDSAPKQRVRAASTRPASVRINRIADVNSPSPPNGRAKRPGRGRGVNGDYMVTDLDYDKESGLWWSNSEFLFFNKDTRMWYDPETNLWYDADENKWFEYNN